MELGHIGHDSVVGCCRCEWSTFAIVMRYTVGLVVVSGTSVAWDVRFAIKKLKRKIFNSTSSKSFFKLKSRYRFTFLSKTHLEDNLSIVRQKAQKVKGKMI